MTQPFYILNAMTFNLIVICGKKSEKYTLDFLTTMITCFSPPLISKEV